MSNGNVRQYVTKQLQTFQQSFNKQLGKIDTKIVGFQLPVIITYQPCDNDTG